MEQIGLFGGTFDPIHWGHLLVAESVREALGLSRILFVPAGQPWLKADRPVSPVRHRLRMVELAIAGNSHFEISTIEANHPGPSYSVDTVVALKDEIGPEAALSFIAGADTLNELFRWKDPSKLAGLCRFVGVRRPDASPVDLPALESAIAGISSRIDIIDIPQIGISATDIRERVRMGRSIRYRVPEPVADYILKNQLYR